MKTNVDGMLFKDAVEAIEPEFGKFHTAVIAEGELEAFSKKINPELFEFFVTYCPNKDSAIIAGVLLGYWIANNEMTRQ